VIRLSLKNSAIRGVILIKTSIAGTLKHKFFAILMGCTQRIIL
jgi:hypothetical protein